jgi:hypothetical protein
MPNPLPVGSELAIKIFAESEYFAAIAKVIYAHPNLGMGLAFKEISLKCGSTVRTWLYQASKSETLGNLAFTISEAYVVFQFDVPGHWAVVMDCGVRPSMSLAGKWNCPARR